MKKILLIASIFIPLATVSLIAYYLYSLYKNISVSYVIKDIGLSKLSSLKLDVLTVLQIDNKSNSELTIKDVKINIFYKDKQLSETVIPEIVINKKNTTTINFNSVVDINENTGELMTLYMQSKPIDLDIKASAKVYKLPLSITKQYIYTKTKTA